MFIAAIALATIFCLSLCVAGVRLRACNWNILDPTVVFWVGFSVFYGVGNLWFCWDVWTRGHFESGRFVFDPHFTSDLQALELVISLTVLYGLAVAVGMFVIGPRVSSTFRIVVDRSLSLGSDPSSGVLLPLCIANWLIQMGLVSRVSALLPHALVSIPSVCCFALNTKLAYEATQARSGRTILFAFGVLSCSVVAGASTGMKEAMLTPILACFTGFMLAYRRLWPVVAVSLAALPIFLALQTWNSMSREVIWDEDRRLGAADRVLAMAEVTRVAIQVGEAQQSDSGLSRLCTLVPMLRTLELLRHDQGISVADGLVGPLVPRVLWPSKPSVVIGSTLYERFTGYEGSSSSPGQPMEAYMYGGWTGVVAIGLSLGLLAAFASVLIGALWGSHKAASLGILIPLSLSFLKCENWLYGYLPALINCVVVLLIVRSVSDMFVAKPSRGQCDGHLDPKSVLIR